MKKWILYILPFLFMNNAYSGFKTGQELLIACTGAVKDTTEGLLLRLPCLEYIDGINDAHGLLSTLVPSAKLYCMPPEGVEVGLVYDKVILYIQEHDDAREDTGRVAVIRAMRDAFPCK